MGAKNACRQHRLLWVVPYILLHLQCPLFAISPLFDRGKKQARGKKMHFKFLSLLFITFPFIRSLGELWLSCRFLMVRKCSCNRSSCARFVAKIFRQITRNLFLFRRVWRPRTLAPPISASALQILP